MLPSAQRTLTLILTSWSAVPEVVGLMRMIARRLVPWRLRHGKGAEMCGGLSSTTGSSFQMAVTALHPMQIVIIVVLCLAGLAHLAPRDRMLQHLLKWRHPRRRLLV